MDLEYYCYNVEYQRYLANEKTSSLKIKVSYLEQWLRSHNVDPEPIYAELGKCFPGGSQHR